MFAHKHWWKYLLGLFVMGAVGVIFMGVETYRGAPPIPDYRAPDGQIVARAEDVLAGQAVFQKYALMEHGSLFGDGGYRGPDYTAESLHESARAMTAFYARDVDLGDEAAAEAAVAARVRSEIKTNRYDERTNTVDLTSGQVQALAAVREMTSRKFTEHGPESFRPAGYITDAAELRDLGTFFYWAGWVCGTRRPGESASYTQNWPYDPLAGNEPTATTLLWSVLGSLALLLALGVVLYVNGRDTASTRRIAGDMDRLATKNSVDAGSPTPSQRATYKFFAVAAVLFLVQVLSGVLTVHDYVGFTTFFGYDIARDLPLTVVRSWHVQISVLWIATCWIAASIYLLPYINPKEPPGQVGRINLLFWMLVGVVAGTVVGTLMGPLGLLGDNWRLLGHQGWEFVELGKLWQVLLFAALVLWSYVIFRGVRATLRAAQPFSLPSWILYAATAITILFLSSFVAQPSTNFVVADFWRWMVVHMWAECFFEVFTTVIVGYFLVHMGLVGREAATRIVFFAVLLFCGSGLLGISHNFYWNAKPEATLAIGSVFSTMQVVPLVLLTVEAWRLRHMPREAVRGLGAGATAQGGFGHADAFRFLLAVNFWNFVGAGAFGFIINLPIVNYYEHGTYLTVNHGHAALMGVYGNLSVCAIIFCARHIVRPEAWSPALFKAVFWSLNVGLMLMVLLDLLPAGILQLQATLEHGLWYSRSQEWLFGTEFQTLTWMRIVGGAIFLLGGVTPLAWFMVSRWRALRDVQMPVPLTDEERIRVDAVAGEA